MDFVFLLENGKILFIPIHYAQNVLINQHLLFEVLINLSLLFPQQMDLQYRRYV